MKKSAFCLSLALAAATFAPSAFAQKPNPELNNPLPGHMPTKARYAREFAGPGGGGSNLAYHSGAPVLTNAHVVAIFWGPSWGSGADASIAQSLTNYINAFGTTPEYNTITQYYQIVGGVQSYIQKSNLLVSTQYDSSTPPTNVTDSIIQSEVLKYAGSQPDPTTIYEVFLPNGSYSSQGSSTSCGGPNLQYCAYHGHFSSSGVDVKYASMPYPSCGGCQTSGFSTTQNFEHFVSHETREAVTDEDLNAWFDRRGYEADDKCAWSPTPFADSNTGKNQDGTGFAFQYEWSNANSGCVKTR